MQDDSDPNAPRYEAEPVVCNACAAIGIGQRTAHDDNRGKGMDGWLWTVAVANGHRPRP